ncbi:MAG TPA: hypothetical protein VH478_02460 [Trebonia sp.]|jgi:hypothetical protein|nr:hypothetical protein [Trebonia sp.]
MVIRIPERQRGRGWGRVLSRRNVVTGAAGAAAAGAAGALLAGKAAPAHAATAAVASGAIAPAVVSLADAATVAMDASAGNDFRLTLGGNRTMGTPVNPGNGQQVLFQVTQGSGAPHTLSWSSAFDFGDGLPQPDLSPGAGQTDLLAFVYNEAGGTWLFVGWVGGFS